MLPQAIHAILYATYPGFFHQPVRRVVFVAVTIISTEQTSKLVITTQAKVLTLIWKRLMTETGNMYQLPPPK